MIEIFSERIHIVPSNCRYFTPLRSPMTTNNNSYSSTPDILQNYLLIWVDASIDRSKKGVSGYVGAALHSGEYCESIHYSRCLCALSTEYRPTKGIRHYFRFSRTRSSSSNPLDGMARWNLHSLHQPRSTRIMGQRLDEDSGRLYRGGKDL